MNRRHFPALSFGRIKICIISWRKVRKWVTRNNVIDGIMATFHRIFPITFDDFHIFEFFLHFTLTVVCVLLRRLLILRARRSWEVTIAHAILLRGKKRLCLCRLQPPMGIRPRLSAVVWRWSWGRMRKWAARGLWCVWCVSCGLWCVVCDLWFVVVTCDLWLIGGAGGLCKSNPIRN